jgi:hypothetical protein
MCFRRKQAPSIWMKYHYQITEVIKFGSLYSKQGRFLPLILIFMWSLIPIFFCSHVNYFIDIKNTLIQIKKMELDWTHIM